jgi:hypothetical protein
MNATTRPTKTDMTPFHDDTEDKRTASAILKAEETRSKRMEAMLAKNAANVDADGNIEILWA